MASSSQREDAKSARSGSGGATTEGVQLKKGPWTAVEDAILIDYVNKNGEGNWNAVMRNSGLQRCGKSCRLRWANHLRPNLKKGAFSPDEERLILELHAKYGNKWARMASQMPGRTDNEIKNFWNTRLKRNQRTGLDMYPSGQLHHPNHHLPRHRKQHHGLKSASQAQMLDFQNQRAIDIHPATSHHKPFVFTTQQNTIPTHRHSQLNIFTEQSNHSLFSSILSNPPQQPLQLSSTKQELDFGFVHLLCSDTPSMQSASAALGTDHITERLLNRNHGGIGTLDDVFLNATQLGRSNTPKENDVEQSIPSKKMKAASTGDEGSNRAVPETTPENSSSGLTSIGMRMEEPVVEINSLDDELTSLLDSFPSASPTPQWYRRATTTADVNIVHQLPGEAAGNGDMDHAPSFGACGSLLSHNLPTIY